MSTGSSRRFMRLNKGRMCCLHKRQFATLCFPALEYTQSSGLDSSSRSHSSISDLKYTEV